MDLVGCRTANESIVLREDVTLSFGTKKRKVCRFFEKRGHIDLQQVYLLQSEALKYLLSCLFASTFAITAISSTLDMKGQAGRTGQTGQTGKI